MLLKSSPNSIINEIDISATMFGSHMSGSTKSTFSLPYVESRHFCVLCAKCFVMLQCPVLSCLTLSLPIPLRLYTLPYWSNPPFLIFDIRALCGLSARAPECQKIKNGGLEQYGAEPFERQQSGTAGVEGVKAHSGHVKQLNLQNLKLCRLVVDLIWYYKIVLGLVDSLFLKPDGMCINSTNLTVLLFAAPSSAKE